MPRQDLLPRNATAIERAVSETIDRLQQLQAGADDVRGFKFEPPMVVIPHLIVEYGLGEIEDYLSGPVNVLREGIAWQRLRGTPAGVSRALDWVEANGVLEENPVWRFKWWWFQIHLPNERRSSSFVGPMTAVANASKPLRSTFARVTAGYDKRGFNLNGHRLNGDGLLNSWSGIRRAEGEPVLSIRVYHRFVVEADGVGMLEARGLHGLHHKSVIDASAPTEQRSGFPSSLATKRVDWNDPDTVPFNNAPFSETESFGAPTPVVQTGY